MRKERLELSQVAPPDPKSGASANFATSAGDANISSDQRTQSEVKNDGITELPNYNRVDLKNAEGFIHTFIV